MLGLLGLGEPGRTCAVVAAALDIVILGDGREQGGAFAQLLSVAQDDLGAFVVFFDPSLDGDHSSLQLPDVADLVEIAAEHDHREWTGTVIGAEVEEGDAVVALFDAQYGSTDTVRLPDVLAGFGNGEAVLEIVGIAWRRVTGPGIS